MKRFGICLLVASAVSLIVPPQPPGRSRDDLFALAADFVAVLLVAVAFYAAVLASAQLWARGRKILRSAGGQERADADDPRGPTM